MICKNQKEAFKKVAEKYDLGGYWKCSDCPKTMTVLRAHNFAHVKSKGKFPELKCETNNIKIKCYKCHCNNDHHQNVKGGGMARQLTPPIPNYQKFDRI